MRNYQSPRSTAFKESKRAKAEYLRTTKQHFPGKKESKAPCTFSQSFSFVFFANKRFYSPSLEYIMAKYYSELDYNPYNPHSAREHQALKTYLCAESFYMAKNPETYVSNYIAMALRDRGLLVIFKVIRS